jgi:anthranilate phosphoribosyltransferase
VKPYLKTIASGGTLSTEDAEAAMHVLMRGEARPEEAAGLLMGLRGRGETVDELVGFARVMREYAVPVRRDDPRTVDLCGTGGDLSGTFNISTAAAFVCAGAGVPVAKHGNRSVSSKCGSADVLEALGVEIALGPDAVAKCLDAAKVAFIFAPRYHPAMRFVMPVRRALGVRTFFNILGPLSNPAGVERQLVGAFSQEVAATMAQILSRLGAAHVITAHAEDGLDELSISAPTTLFESSDEERLVQTKTVTPEQHGLGRAPLEALRGGSAEDNARTIRDLLAGERAEALRAHRDVTLLNAAYALHTSGAFGGLENCFDEARESLASGSALRALDTLVETSQVLA